ncbi:hypothetical protein [Listeria innocua]|uniref:hypothetical protein n=1 Tax=Listeria innocua TaxID=1642 RepID=UPI001C8917E7|nr:hypothetical protein [Listeria innocua]
MYTNYNMKQLTLDLSTSFSPKEIMSPFLSMNWSKRFRLMNRIFLVDQENMIWVP